MPHTKVGGDEVSEDFKKSRINHFVAFAFSFLQESMVDFEKQCFAFAKVHIFKRKIRDANE